MKNIKTIGIIGGGQLGMFMAIAAYEMGFETIVYDAKEDCCAKNVASKFYLGSFNDEAKLNEFAKECDIITFEFENINSTIVKNLSDTYNIPQTNRPLVISSSRLNEKKMANELDIKTTNWHYIESEADLKEHSLKYPYLMKSNSLGYDGKGQYMINQHSDLDKVDFRDTTYIAEEKIEFDYEISIIAIRSINDEFVTYDPFYNQHHKGILNLTHNFPECNESVTKQAKDAIKKIMFEKDIRGVLCCEFFVKDNVVYFNEMAPRPHNSGHITMDTHYFSQYDNHLRGILGLPLGTTKIKDNQGYMVNVLGQDVEKTYEYLKDNNPLTKYYDYHKSAVENRKVGHLISFNKEHLEWFKQNWK